MAVHYGGQALIEGVLIRGRAGAFAAVRSPDGRVVTREERLEGGRSRLLGKVPVLRGVLALRDTLAVGSRMLMFSADVAQGGDGSSAGSVGKGATLGAALAAASVFAVLPSLVANAVGRRRRADGATRSRLRANVLESSVRIGFLVSYLGAISRLSDVQRIFAYHGAEHKTISALEAQVDLVPDAVQQFSTAHPRCGTAFLLQSMLTSTALYALIGNRSPFGRIATRVALIPVIAGVSFEVLQFNARHLDSSVVRALNAPGMLLQRMTTREPTNEQVEVAISALKGAMAMDDGTV